jgi:hypothetical protein
MVEHMFALLRRAQEITMTPRNFMPGLALALMAIVAIAALFNICNPAHAAAPAAGDAYVYRVVNAYNQETVGHLRHEITEASAAQGQVVSVTVDTPALGLPRTEILTPDGQWLRHTLSTHGRTTDYEFTQALPAVQTATGGNSWSVRVNAMVPAHSARRSVRIDGTVMGNERIRVPAGEFDTVKIRRIIYPGDAGDFKSETRIVETDWHAPALGRSVRTETNSSWQEPCLRRPCTFRGDWHVIELAEARPATR